MRWSWLAALLIFLPREARAFCRSTTNLSFTPTEEQPCDTAGKPLFWPGRCVEVRVHRTASKQVDLATARSVTAGAFAKWANVTCDSCGAAGKPSIVVTEAGPTDCEFGYLRDGANTNVVIFRDNDWQHEPGMLALTTVSFRKDSGEIVDADIEINSDPYQQKISTGPAAADAYDLDSILTHEGGHLLGLAHSPIADATMRPRYDQGDLSLRDLATDDVCGICAAAPPGRDVPCNPSSSASCAETGDAGTTNTETTKGDGGGGCSMASDSGQNPLWIFAAIALSRLCSHRAQRSRNRRRSCTSCSSRRT